MTEIIAIDGPAGSGKSSIAKGLAQKLGFLHIDTGAIYRTLAYEALQTDISLENPQALAVMASELQNISDSPAIRTEQISLAASKISQYPEVRANLLGIQRRLAENSARGAVLEGRDIGTVVFPQAQHKFFVTASIPERTQRRLLELQSRHIQADYNQVLQDLKERDSQDENRAIAPLKPAPDAILVDTTGYSIEQVVEAIICFL